MEEPKENSWIHATREATIRGKKMKLKPSPYRIQDRKAVSEALRRKGSAVEKVDRIINYFRIKYEGHQWAGLSKPERQRLFRERGGRCWICGGRLKWENMTVDHIISRGSGGDSSWANLDIAHLMCNQDRGSAFTDKFGYLKEESAGVYTDGERSVLPEKPGLPEQQPLSQ